MPTILNPIQSLQSPKHNITDSFTCNDAMIVSNLQQQADQQYIQYTKDKKSAEKYDPWKQGL